MRVGACVFDTAHWTIAAKKGFDFLEAVFAAVANADDATFEEMLKAHKEAGIDVESCMSYFPGDFKLYAYDPATGEGTEEFAEIEKNVREYSERGFARASQLGIKIAVIGSGKARNIPADMKREVAEAQFKRIVEICSEVAEKYGAIIVLEPLNSKETNYMSTLDEAVEVCRKINNKNIFVLNDFFHSMIEKEPTSSLYGAGKLLAHTHISDKDRGCPSLEKDGEYLMPLVQELVNSGYDARISFECMYNPDFETATEAALPLVKAIRELKPQN